ncbi:MAG TPA: PmoA family protein [Chitinophagaceae bacterium]
MKKFVALLLTSTWMHTLLAQEIKINLKQSSNDVIACIPLKVALPPSATAYELTDKKDGFSYPAQLADSMTLVCILRGEQDKGVHTYTVKPGRVKLPPGVRVEKQAKGLLVKAENKPILFYNTALMLPPGSPDYYKRSGFIHPLYSPDGSVLTDDFPVGHMHQHGIFLTWVNTTFRSKPLDFWNQHNKTGTVQHSEVLSIEEGPVFSRITTSLQHVSLEYGPVISEIWTITIYPFTDRFVFDLESEQTNITSDTLYINKYHYGGLAFRGSREWNSHDSLHFRNRWQVLTNEGKDTSNANHTRARWVDASGKINGKVNGVTIFGDAANFRSPQFIRVHPDMPYWCFSPMVDSGFSLNPGESFKSRFRFVVHAGSTDVEQIEDMENWGEKVRVQK